MSFKAYIKQRRITNTPAGDFVRDARIDLNLPEPANWDELETYLERVSTLVGLIPAAREVWQDYERERKQHATTRDADIEQERLADLAKSGIEDPERFLPGSFGCHEALHTTSLIMAMVARDLIEHPTIMLDPEFYERARRIHSDLFDLYQAIGAKHLNND